MPGMIIRSGVGVLLLTILWGSLSGCPGNPGVDPDNPAGVSLARSADAAYVPGSEFTITVTVDATHGSSINALGLTESLPEGWQYIDTGGGGASLPDIAPFEGRSGTLGFAWIDIPGFPFSFNYTVLVPETTSSTVQISGRADYYQNQGIESSDVLVSTHARADSAENPAAVSLLRTAGPTYQPGESFTVRITLNAANGPSITALGLIETIPLGWQFETASGDGAPGPALKPLVGEGGELNFAWIAIPEFPYSFEYVLHVPEDESGPVSLSGRVDYYQSLGLYSSDEISSLFTSAAR